MQANHHQHHHQPPNQQHSQRSPQVSSFTPNSAASSTIYNHSTMTIQKNSTHQFYNHPPMSTTNFHVSPTSSLTNSHHNQQFSANNLTFSSSESNFAFGTSSSLSGSSGFNHTAGQPPKSTSLLHKSDF